jgi:two-component system nitrogen regulation sensor histidine kinase NtrY
MHLSLAARFSLLVVALCSFSVFATILAMHYLNQSFGLVWVLVSLTMSCIACLSVLALLRPILALFRAMGGTVLSYQDGDYSGGLYWSGRDELAELVQKHNALGATLRAQRLNLVQRELLLDTMLQNTPVAMLLVADQGVIIFANIVARQLLHRGIRLEGYRLSDILQQTSPSLSEAIERGGDGLFTVRQAQGEEADEIEDDEVYHIARRSFSLNGRQHELFLLRHLTTELRRQEVQTWKKVIRVISHELNNSLAPIASLASSAAELTRRQKYERLPDIFRTIEERTRHLESFIAGYARFAKLPSPHCQTHDWDGFLSGLQTQIAFRIAGDLPEDPANFDAAQMEQALLNLLKNAHESDTDSALVELSVRRIHDGWRIDVADRGSGMSDVVMANALVPFYSTKRSGTGLGLALVREIIEAHGGRIALNNRPDGGLIVSLMLPV